MQSIIATLVQRRHQLCSGTNIKKTGLCWPTIFIFHVISMAPVDDCSSVMTIGSLLATDGSHGWKSTGKMGGRRENEGFYRYLMFDFRITEGLVSMSVY